MPVSQLNDHDVALWLLANLQSLEPFGNGGFKGRLPAQFDFDAVEHGIGHRLLVGMIDATDRSIEFFPASAHVYETLDQLITLNGNHEAVPDRFTIRDIDFTSGPGVEEPPCVRAYRVAVKLVQAIKGFADVHFPDGDVLFVKSHDDRLRLHLSYAASDLNDVVGIDEFLTTFFHSEHHRDQKRAVVRQSVLGQLKGIKDAKFGDLLRRAPEFVTAVRSAYAMYMAEFTFEKVRAEVEKDNLDSALKLGKAVSEIQNQLLAMPVALLLVGGQMDQVNSLNGKNLGLLTGAVVFAWLMDILVRNQASSLGSIATEIEMRKAKVDNQSSDIAAKFRTSFEDLNRRLDEQRRTLRKLRILVALGLLFSCCFFVWSSFEDARSILVSCVEALFGFAHKAQGFVSAFLCRNMP